MKFNFSTMTKGLAMGIAEVIPGVSGGTIAFISGIYEDLLKSIKSIDIEMFRLIFSGKFKEAWEKMNGWFVLSLAMGMIIGIVFGIFVVTYMLKNFPEPLWGFFFGLVIASAIMISKQIHEWNAIKIIALFVGIGIALTICMISPAEGSTNPLYIFICGVIAISAFILPGISGSFMLLLMGTYTLIIPSLKSIMVNHDTASMYIILIFGIGCLVGIATFSRVLSYLFANYKDSTLVLLTGFLIGSLYKIWPWRNIQVVVDKITGTKINVSSIDEYSVLELENFKILKEVNVLPVDYWMSTPKIIVSLMAIVLGFLTVYFIELNSNKKTV